MKYTRFEELVLVIGGVTILGSIAVSYSGGPPELVAVTAQLMLFGVLVAAVRFGRRGGLIAAVVAASSTPCCDSIPSSSSRRATPRCSS